MYKLTWQERVRETEKFHKALVRQDAKHTIQNTADKLRRSFGSVCEDLMIASYMKTYPKLEEYKTFHEAIEWVKEKKLEHRRR